jgi:hypothetical protein
MGTTLKTIIEHWQYLAPIVKRPENEKDYKASNSRPLEKSLQINVL